MRQVTAGVSRVLHASVGQMASRPVFELLAQQVALAIKMHFWFD
jgi:hypothetical protein